jgi:predicted RNA-binding Zn ribbon-like protein
MARSRSLEPPTPAELPPEELRFLFLAGRDSLDLVATIGERWRRRFERLRDPADLGRWLEDAGLPTVAAPDADDLQLARELRAAVEALAVAAMDSAPRPAAAAAVVDRVAAGPDLAPQLHAAAGGDRPALRPGTVAAALSTVARDAVDLFGGPLADRVRECAHDDCALVFVDTSRPGRRRWCSMAGCGNRTKTARYRRSRTGEAG